MMVEVRSREARNGSNKITFTMLAKLSYGYSIYEEEEHVDDFKVRGSIKLDLNFYDEEPKARPALDVIVKTRIQFAEFLKSIGLVNTSMNVDEIISKHMFDMLAKRNYQPINEMYLTISTIRAKNKPNTPRRMRGVIKQGEKILFTNPTEDDLKSCITGNSVVLLTLSFDRHYSNSDLRFPMKPEIVAVNILTPGDEVADDVDDLVTMDEDLLSKYSVPAEEPPASDMSTVDGSLLSKYTSSDACQ